jgi:3-phenylpropionate/cinnamic acid dioxygenase small subunit
MQTDSADLALWFEVVTWLNREAELLDSGQLEPWLALLTDDIRYTMPIRLTRERGGGSDVDFGAPHFQEDMGTLRMRVERLKTEFAWAEDPPSRTRRFVTNVRPRVVAEGVDVRSYLLLYRSRGDATTAELVSAERHDLFQRTATGLRLQRREVLIDQASLAVRNLAVML